MTFCRAPRHCCGEDSSSSLVKRQKRTRQRKTQVRDRRSDARRVGGRAWSYDVTWECSVRTGTALRSPWRVTGSHVITSSLLGGATVGGRQLHTKEGSIQRFPPHAALALMTLASSQRARVAAALPRRRFVQISSVTAGRFHS